MASRSYWCYSCSRFVLISDSISCPDCDGGFLQHIQEPIDSTPSDSLHRLPSAATVSRTRSPNPVIVLRGSNPSDVTQSQDRSNFQMFYDDGSDSGLRPLPSSMTEFLLGSGFDRLLDQLSQVELNTIRNHRSTELKPASKSAIEALPVIEIGFNHLESDFQSNCAVCKENFVLKSEAREMPCDHIYHPECILPWLAIRNSCPVCRHEIPTEDMEDITGSDLPTTATTTSTVVENQEEENSAAGLTIWRLPGGGFAVGRIPGGLRGGDRMMPVVYTEVDGGRLGDERLPRRVAWGSRRGSSRERANGLAGRFMRLFGCFNVSSRSVSSRSRSRIIHRSSSSFSMFSTASSSSSSRRRNWLA